VRFTIEPNTNQVFFSILWRNPTNNLQFRLAGPGGTVDTYTGISPRNTVMYYCVITNPTKGQWTLTITNNDPSSQLVDGYIESTPYEQVRWIDFVSSERTVGSPATADYAIAVGSYKTQLTTDIGNLSVFSSKGTRIDGTLKPEVTAPGEYIICGRASNTNQVGVSRPVRGTSFSAPHVAGVVALMQQMSYKTANQTRTTLLNTVRKDNFTENPVATPNANWGYGKLDAFNATIPEFTKFIVPMIISVAVFLCTRYKSKKHNCAVL
jgi:subtilisin family serine protease